MLPENENRKLAQSASALGAALLGFGLGARFSASISSFLLYSVIVMGGIVHVAGMYVLQMKGWSEKAGSIAKTLWLTAWLCLLSLIALAVYLLLK